MSRLKPAPYAGVFPVEGYAVPEPWIIEMRGLRIVPFTEVRWLSSSSPEDLDDLIPALDDPEIEVWAAQPNREDWTGPTPARVLAERVLDLASEDACNIDHGDDPSAEDAAIMAGYLTALSRYQEEAGHRADTRYGRRVPSIWEILRVVVAHPDYFAGIRIPDARAWPGGHQPAGETLGG